MQMQVNNIVKKHNVSNAKSGGAQKKFFAPAVQPKLTVNQPGDVYEQEADAVADKIMRMQDVREGDSFFKISPVNIQRKCQHCEEEEKKLQRKETSGETSSLTGTANYLQSLSGKGRPLSIEEKNFFEPRFGYDFSNVRLHTDSEANKSAAGINAHAYTHGNNIVFGQSQFQPGSETGRKLIAHELTHTIQQKGGPAGNIQRQVSQIDINCGNNQINFARDDGSTSYDLDECNVTDGEYDASVTVTGNNVDFTLTNADPSTQFHFHYAIRPGQPNPSTFFAGQSAVHIRCTHDAGAGGVEQEIPVTFVGDEMMYIPAFDSSSGGGLPLGYGGMLGSAGLSTYITSLGDLGWLNQAGYRSAFAPELWRGLIPNPNMVTLDRTINLNDNFTDFIQGLGPRIENEGPLWLNRTFPDNIPPSLGGTGSPLTFSQAELDSIPALVRRFNMGGTSALTPQELLLLRRAVAIQGGAFGGSTPGSPLASYSEAGRTAPFLSGSPSSGEVRYRVRVQVNRSSALDTSGTNDLTLGEEALTNVEEAEFMVIANSRRQIVSVQRIPTGGAEPGWILRNAGALRWGGRILLVGGVLVSGYRIANATPQERPRVIAQEGGGWGGGLLGTELGAGACIAFGIATEGVGLLLCGIAGGIGGGILGSAAAGAAVDSAQSGWGSSPGNRFPDGTWYDRSGTMHMGPGPKW
ncbi:MAG TPA: DUF4157 domain-containing protein [Chitinophagaceae bacterium]|nr:DUF4157 domain-containing protein [Chitinophagaceae bacterium]